MANKWITNHSDVVGVKVIEMPLTVATEGCADRTAGVLVAVDPGVTAVVTPTNVPWRVEEPSSEALCMGEISRREGIRRAQLNARESMSQSG